MTSAERTALLQSRTARASQCLTLTAASALTVCTPSLDALMAKGRRQTVVTDTADKACFRTWVTIWQQELFSRKCWYTQSSFNLLFCLNLINTTSAPQGPEARSSRPDA